MSPSPSFRFGPFWLVPEQGLLLKGNKSVRLGSRALELLTALVERKGELVSKDELMARVWPNTFVDEGSLRAQVVAVRKALAIGRYRRTIRAQYPWSRVSIFWHMFCQWPDATSRRYSRLRRLYEYAAWSHCTVCSRTRRRGWRYSEQDIG